MYGKLEKEALMTITDVNTRELATLGVLMAFALFLGFNPGPALNVFSPAVDLLIENYNTALMAGGVN